MHINKLRLELVQTPDLEVHSSVSSVDAPRDQTDSIQYLWCKRTPIIELNLRKWIQCNPIFIVNRLLGRDPSALHFTACYVTLCLFQNCLHLQVIYFVH